MAKFELKDPLSWIGKDEPLTSATDIEVDKIKIVYSQPRKNKGSVEIDELIQSIKAHGLIEPVVVKQAGDKEFYNLICGERRLTAVKALGLQKIATFVRNDIKDEDIFIIQLIENIHRKELEPLELANAYKKLCEKKNIRDVAALLGKSKSHVQDMLTLLDVEEELGDKISRNNTRKAIEIARIKNKKIRKEAIKDFDKLDLAGLKNRKYSSAPTGEEIYNFVSKFNETHSAKLSVSFMKRLDRIELKISKKTKIEEILKQLINLKED